MRVDKFEELAAKHGILPYRDGALMINVPGHKLRDALEAFAADVERETIEWAKGLRKDIGDE